MYVRFFKKCNLKRTRVGKYFTKNFMKNELWQKTFYVN